MTITKRVYTYLLLGGLIAGLAACNNSSDTTPSDTDSTLYDGGAPDSGLSDSDSNGNAVETPDYDDIFVEDHLAIYEIHIDEDQWTQLLASPDTYVTADLKVDDEEYPDVGVRILGKADRTKASMRIRFNLVHEQQTFHGVKRVNLHGSAGDTSLIREALALTLMRDAGIPAPRSSFVWVTTNQGPKGVYTLIEQVDKKFLYDRFGEKSGNLYKGERGAALLYLGDDQSLYPDTVYERKTNQKNTDRSELVNFTKVLNETSENKFDSAISEVLDLDGFLMWLAVNTWMVSMDSYAGTVDNYYFYHGQDGRFRFIPWDMNQAFGNYHGVSCTGAGSLDCKETMGTDEFLSLEPDKPYCRCSTGGRPLIEKILARPALRERYHEILEELIDGVLAPKQVKQKMHALRERIEEAAHEDTQKDCYQPPCTNDTFNASFEKDDPESDISNRIPGLEPFIDARDQTIRQALGK